jgi:hypothetical protein
VLINTLAYYATVLITGVKSFIVQVPGMERDKAKKDRKRKLLESSRVQTRECFNFFSMRLCHPPDGCTSPKYKLLSFKLP